jgi:hypothetical protein
VGVRTNTAAHITYAKQYYTALITQGMWDNGALPDYARWADPPGSNIGSMWSHTAGMLAPAIAGIDILARYGDTSLYTQSQANQTLGSAGSVVSWQTALDLMARLATKTTLLYGTTTAGGVGPNTVLSWDPPPSKGTFSDFAMMAANVFYQNANIRAAMNRALKPTATNSQTGGCADASPGGCFSGTTAFWPDIPFMLGNLDSGQINPYGATPPPPEPVVTVDSTYAGYTTGPIDDGVINASGATATTWASADTALDHWIVIDFGATRQISTATLYWAYNAYQQKYMTSNKVDVQYWNGSAYQTVATMNYAGDVPSTTVNFPAVSTSRIRFYQGANQGNPIYPGVIWITEADHGTQTTTLLSPPSNLHVISTQ